MADKDLYNLVNKNHFFIKNFIWFLYIKSKIFYYFRERYYNQAYTSANEGLKRFVNDGILKFYAAMAQLMDGTSYFTLQYDRILF